MARGDTNYSPAFAGDERNHKLAVRFDVTDHYVGISQWDGSWPVGPLGHKDLQRVLLTPAQVSELLAFIGAEKIQWRPKVQRRRRQRKRAA